ncbi:MAG: hypothetical protein KDD54_00595 [Flavobacteriales bacterium]|nr:hypothetical protein [Flavobacteriales bacterium]
MSPDLQEVKVLGLKIQRDPLLMEDNLHMIPRKIHYCWFSGEPFPPLIKNCLQSWKDHLGGYELVLWDVDKVTKYGFSCPYFEHAKNQRLWAFMTDYVRFKALYEEGGIYLDMDVFVLRSFDDLFGYRSFWAKDINGLVEPVVIGAKKEDPLIGRIIDLFECIEEGQMKDFQFIALPQYVKHIFSSINANTGVDETSRVEGHVFFSSEYFCSLPNELADKRDMRDFITDRSYAVHLWDGNWFDEFRFLWMGRTKSGWRKIWKKILRNPIQPIQFYKDVFYHVKRSIFN